MLRRHPALLVLAAILVFSGVHPLAAEPANLAEGKQAVQKYIDTGGYARDVAAVAQSVTKYLAKRVPQGAKDKKMAVVFDIDETTLSNLPHITANDFAYIKDSWDEWVQSAQAKAIIPVQVAYDAAVRGKVAIFFITGRHESERIATEKNLREAGYETWAQIYFKPAPSADRPLTSRQFKAGIRQQLTADGYVIIANIGDQQSDLAGGFAEKTFKLPNPFYRTE